MHFPWELLKMYSTISFPLFKACPSFTMISFFGQHYLISNYLRIFQIPFCYLFLINSTGINKDALYDLKPFQLVVICFEDQNTVCFSECSADTWNGVSFGLFCGWSCWVNLSGNVSWMAGTDGVTRVLCVCSDDFPPLPLVKEGYPTQTGWDVRTCHTRHRNEMNPSLLCTYIHIWRGDSTHHAGPCWGCTGTRTASQRLWGSVGWPLTPVGERLWQICSFAGCREV